MPQFDPEFVAAYLADNVSSDSKNMTEFEKADSLEQSNAANFEGFNQSSERNMASFEAAAEEWDAVAEVEATFGEGRKETVAVVAEPIVTMEKVLEHLQGTWMDDYLAQVSLMKVLVHSLCSTVVLKILAIQDKTSNSNEIANLL